MQVVFVGRKEDSSSDRRRVCSMDFVTQDSIPDTDYVIVVRTGTTEHCFALETLSQWFVESTLTWNVLPRHPYVGTQVPAAVYREVVEQARMFVPHFAFSLQSSVASLPVVRRSFVTTGSTMSASSALADDAFSADEIFDMIDWSQQGGSASPPPPPRLRHRSRSRSPPRPPSRRRRR